LLRASCKRPHIATGVMLAGAIVIVRPEISVPAVSEFASGETGPVFSGSLFPFLFVTIACGACSGFHGLVCSGTTSKQIDKESHTKAVGYGAMLAEGFVAFIALVTIMIITAPLAAAVIVTLGYDLIWWGIMMVVLVEMGVVTPPFGLNLFIMKSMVPDVPLTTIFRGVMPFVIADTIKVVLLIAFPALVLWLPSVAFNR
jgi:carbon starvation protein CstA